MGCGYDHQSSMVDFKYMQEVQLGQLLLAVISLHARLYVVSQHQFCVYEGATVRAGYCLHTLPGASGLPLHETG